MERKQVTLMLNAEEADFLMNAVEQLASARYRSYPFAEEFSYYVLSKLQMEFTEDLT